MVTFLECTIISGKKGCWTVKKEGCKNAAICIYAVTDRRDLNKEDWLDHCNGGYDVADSCSCTVVAENNKKKFL